MCVGGRGYVEGGGDGDSGRVVWVGGWWGGRRKNGGAGLS